MLRIYCLFPSRIHQWHLVSNFFFLLRQNTFRLWLDVQLLFQQKYCFGFCLFLLFLLAKFPVMVHCVAPQMLVLAEERGQCRARNGRVVAPGAADCLFW